MDPQQQPPPRGAQARTWRRYLRFFGPQGVADLDDELAFHVEMRMQEYLARGMSEDDARRAAHHRLGDLAAARAACVAVTHRTQRRMTRTQIIDSFTQDLRFALRTLRRNKGWTAVAILTLALGIGVNTGMFSVVNHLLLHPIAYPHANRVAIVFQAPVAGKTTGHLVMVTPKARLLQAWREHARSLEAIEPFVTTDVTLEQGNDAPRIASVASVLPSFAAFAGRAPLLGRMFTDAEAKGEASVALISEGTWRTHYGARTDVVGSTILLNGNVTTIIGVLPEDLSLPRASGNDVDVWQPLDIAKHEYGMLAVVRIRDGVTKEAAQDELNAIAARPEVKTADMAAYETMLKSPADLVGYRQSLIMLSVAVALVLLIACANVIHLLLARASTRQRELAIRAAIGAGGGRLFRQLLTESMLLAAAGCVAGALLGWAGLRALVAVRPESLGDLAAVRMDGATLLVTAGIAVLTGLVFGVVGAVQAARHSTHDALKAGSLATSAGRGRGRARALLVVTEMALCTLLLVGSILLLRSVMHLQRLDPGFDPRGMYALDLNIPDDRYPTPAAKQAFDAEAVRRARQIPGVEAVTLVASAPPAATFLLGVIQVEGQPTPAKDAAGFLRFNGVSPDYFRLMRMPIVEGTTFTDTSDAGGQMIVNASLARQLWPGQSAIGR
ncbi:MAG TPA: ABC transporter permease, partial [Gemmatimonadaceae bacterium]|nr:ABC transporter permease [Gemmatimonadaceae bacterium]